MLSSAIQCKQAPYTPILTKVGKGRHVCVRVPNGRFSRSAWVENIANAWLPIRTYGKLQRAITLIVRCESKFFQVKSLVSTHSRLNFL